MSVRVVARIRPLLDKELDKDVIVHAASNDDGKTSNVVKIPNPKNESEEFSFTFNGVYDQLTTQEELFAAEGKIPSSSLFFTALVALHVEDVRSLTLPFYSIPSSQVPLPRPRSYDICLWRHRNRKDSYNAWWIKIGRAWCYPETP